MDNIYNDSSFLDDLQDFSTNDWSYTAPLLEYTTESIYSRTVRQPSYGIPSGLIENAQSAPPAIHRQVPRSTASNEWNASDSMQRPPERQLRYSSPGVALSPHYRYTREGSEILNGVGCKAPKAHSEDSSSHTPHTNGLTTGAVSQLQENVMETQANAMQSWIAEAYLAGQRVQPSNQSQAGTSRSQQGAPTPLFSTSFFGQAQFERQYAMSQQHIERATSLQSDTRTTIGNLSCDHPGCDHTCTSSDDLKHHRRCHIPTEQRPHPCPYCTQRFLYPREVERHLPTHGLGLRYYCKHSSCPYATRGFGRQDHLTRHVRTKHVADSV